MPKVYDAIVIGSGAGGGMYAKVLTEAGASVLLVDAGSHQIDRDIRHHQWRWELPYRDQYQQDQDYTVRLKTTVHAVGTGDSESVTLFDGSAHNTYYNNHFWAKRRDWKYTFPENKPYRWVRVRALGGKTNCWDANTTRWGSIEFQPASYDGYDVDWPITYEEMAPQRSVKMSLLWALFAWLRFRVKVHHGRSPVATGYGNRQVDASVELHCARDHGGQ